MAAGLSSTTSPAAKFYYGIGAVAYGIKDSGFSYLLLLYYNQVLGLPQSLVGAGIFIALLADAVTDPVVGSASDHLHSRWGRRHPFMYASALPVGICYFLLWSPPAGLSPDGLFIYFVSLAILVRVSITFYEIPSSALVAELTDDYHQRTMFLSLRHFFGWWGGLALTVTAYVVFLVPSDEYPVGVLNRAGYEAYAVTASLLIVAAIMLSSLGTHGYIPRLRQPQHAQYPPVLTMVRHTLDTLRERSFGALFISALFGSLATGMSTSLSIYINTFYWELDNTRIAMITSTLFGSAICATLLAPRCSRLLGKKTAAVTLGVTSGVLVLMATTLLAIIDFPRDAQPGQTDPQTVWNLGLLYAPAMFVFYMLAILSILAYRISQDSHEQNLRTLAESRR